LQEIRNGHFYSSLPPAWRSALDPLREARLAWLAYNGNELLVIAGGAFSSPPAGTARLTPKIILAGSANAVRTASQQYATGRTGAPELVAKGAPVMHGAIWAVIRGDTHLPLSGNLANLNRMLHFTQYTTAALEGDSVLRIDLTGYCATPDVARRLEENLRGLVTLSSSATHSANLAALLKSIQVNRDGSNVHVHFEANPSAAGELMR